MNIHEYQAKQLMREYGVPVSDGRVVLKAEEAKTAASELDGPVWVVKAQIHAGGRGKGHFKEASAGEKGGVRLTRSVEEAADEVQRMLGRTLVTHQSGPAGRTVNRIYIEEGAGIARELYLALLIDRKTSHIAFVCSTEGGMDIEEVAAKTPTASSPSPLIPPPASRVFMAAASPSRLVLRDVRCANASNWSAAFTGCSLKRTPKCWKSTR